jgi:hypothetical protein
VAPHLEGAGRCPHCGGLTVTEPSTALRWRCGACGGGQIPGVALEPGAQAVHGLSRARRLGVNRVSALILAAGALAAAFVAWMLAALSLLLHGPFVAVMMGGLGIGAFMGSGALRGWAQRLGAAAREALDEAWADAAATLAQARGGSITAPELAQVTRIPEADAEAILGRLSARGARVMVDADLQLRYRVGEMPSLASETENDDDRARGRADR